MDILIIVIVAFFGIVAYLDLWFRLTQLQTHIRELEKRVGISDSFLPRT